MATGEPRFKAVNEHLTKYVVVVSSKVGSVFTVDINCKIDNCFFPLLSHPCVTGFSFSRTHGGIFPPSFSVACRAIEGRAAITMLRRAWICWERSLKLPSTLCFRSDVVASSVFWSPITTVFCLLTWITPVRTDPEAHRPRPLIEGRVHRVVRRYARRHVSI